MQKDREICALICRNDGVKAKDVARELQLDRQEVNHILYSSPLMKELCWQDRDFCWHGIMKQTRPHTGLQEFAGYYDLVEFSYFSKSVKTQPVEAPREIDRISSVFLKNPQTVGMTGLQKKIRKLKMTL